MTRIEFIAVSFLAIAPLSAAEPSVRWELTKPLSHDEYREGKLLTFHGHSSGTFSRPEIQDFCLELLSPARTWIPMIFGRDWELEWAAKAEMTDVHLYLKQRVPFVQPCQSQAHLAERDGYIPR